MLLMLPYKPATIVKAPICDIFSVSWLDVVMSNEIRTNMMKMKNSDFAFCQVVVQRSSFGVRWK